MITAVAAIVGRRIDAHARGSCSRRRRDEDHREWIEADLHRRCIAFEGDVCRLLDADTTLGSLLLDGEPDRDHFRSSSGRCCPSSARATPAACPCTARWSACCGPDGTIDRSDCTSRSSGTNSNREFPFSLLCGYLIDGSPDSTDLDPRPPRSTPTSADSDTTHDRSGAVRRGDAIDARRTRGACSPHSWTRRWEPARRAPLTVGHVRSKAGWTPSVHPHSCATCATSPPSMPCSAARRADRRPSRKPRTTASTTGGARTMTATRSYAVIAYFNQRLNHGHPAIENPYANDANPALSPAGGTRPRSSIRTCRCSIPTMTPWLDMWSGTTGMTRSGVSDGTSRWPYTRTRLSS